MFCEYSNEVTVVNDTSGVDQVYSTTCNIDVCTTAWS